MSAANAGAAKTDKAAALSRSFLIEIPHLRRFRHQPTTWLQFGCFRAKPKAQCRTCEVEEPTALGSPAKPKLAGIQAISTSRLVAAGSRRFKARRNVIASLPLSLHFFQIRECGVNHTSTLLAGVGHDAVEPAADKDD